jgi:AraC-like DNA-binding protein
MRADSRSKLLRLALGAADAAFRGQCEDAEAALQRCESFGQHDAELTAAIRLGRAQLAMSRSRFDAARIDARAAAVSLARLGRRQEAVRAQEIEARIFWKLGENARAQTLFQKLLVHWERWGEGKARIDGEVRCLTHLTSLHSRAQRYEQAIVTGTRAVLLAKKSSDLPFYFPKAANALAGVHFRRACQSHPDNALATHITALGPTASTQVLSHCRNARALMDEVRQIAIASNNRHQAALYGSNIGQLMVLMNEIDAALPLMLEFLMSARERNDKFQEADALQAIGWAHLCAARHQTALRHLTEAIAIAESLDAKPLLVTLHYDYAAAAEKTGDYKIALLHHRAYTRLWQQLSAEKQAQQETVANDAEPFYLKRAERYIELCIPHPPSTADVARHVGVSVRSLQVAFQRYRSTTPKSFILNLRYQAVHAALENDRGSGAVARACVEFGFEYSSHFVREFKRRFGKTPSMASRPDASKAD